MTEDEMVGWHHRVDWREFWASSRSWWWTARPGLLQFMGLQRVRCDWAELRICWTLELWHLVEGIFGWGLKFNGKWLLQGVTQAISISVHVCTVSHNRTMIRDLKCRGRPFNWWIRRNFFINSGKSARANTSEWFSSAAHFWCCPSTDNSSHIFPPDFL